MAKGDGTGFFTVYDSNLLQDNAETEINSLVQEDFLRNNLIKL